MSQETVGNIRGFVPYEYIVNYIKNNIDSSVTYKISRTKYCKIKDCDWHYKINEHSEDDEYYYTDSGFIFFKYNNLDTQLFYYYSNLCTYENLDYYKQYNLGQMVETETTQIRMLHDVDNIKLIKNIIIFFSDGWIDENDCDDEVFYFINATTKNNIKISSKKININISFQFIKNELGNDIYKLIYNDKIFYIEIKNDDWKCRDNIPIELVSFIDYVVKNK